MHGTITMKEGKCPGLTGLNFDSGSVTVQYLLDFIVALILLGP